MSAVTTIHLKGLRFFATHGWYDEEAITGNEFEVTITATVPATGPVVSLSDTVDYSRLYAIAKTIFAQREGLLETVAQKIASSIEAEFAQIKTLEITITKLNPLIEAFTGTVGITYSTTR